MPSLICVSGTCCSGRLSANGARDQHERDRRAEHRGER